MKNKKNKIAKRKQLFVNGPLNVMRLEGNIFGIHKIIYLFMDYHLEPNDQRQCPTINSIDIIKYLHKTFLKIDNAEQFDFFYEMYKKESQAHSLIPNRKQMYIEEVSKYIRYSLDMRDEKYNNKVPNIRTHFADIRGHFDNYFSPHISQIYNMLWRAIGSTYINKETCSNIDTLLNDISNDLSNLNNRFSQVDHNTTGITTEIINKIISGYKHNESKKIYDIMRSYILKYDQEIRENIQEIRDIFGKDYENIQKVINTDNNLIQIDKYRITYFTSNLGVLNILRKLYKCVSGINILTVDYAARIMDSYFLRRFIDKNEITRAGIYTGIEHSTYYVFVLVKYFGFKITHVAYDKYSIDDLNNDIKKADIHIDIRHLIYPEKLVQCSDMTNFPPNFS